MLLFWCFLSSASSSQCNIQLKAKFSRKNSELQRCEMLLLVFICLVIMYCLIAIYKQNLKKNLARCYDCEI